MKVQEESIGVLSSIGVLISVDFNMHSLRLYNLLKATQTFHILSLQILVKMAPASRQGSAWPDTWEVFETSWLFSNKTNVATKLRSVEGLPGRWQDCNRFCLWFIVILQHCQFESPEKPWGIMRFLSTTIRCDKSLLTHRWSVKKPTSTVESTGQFAWRNPRYDQNLLRIGMPVRQGPRRTSYLLENH